MGPITIIGLNQTCAKRRISNSTLPSLPYNCMVSQWVQPIRPQAGYSVDCSLELYLMFVKTIIGNNHEHKAKCRFLPLNKIG